MNMRKKILFSAGALAVALAPAVGFGLPEAAGAEVSPVAFSVSVASPGVLPTQTPPPNPDDAPETSDEPADSAELTQTELGDIIEFPDKEQVPYVGGQPDVKSAAPFIRDHSGVFSKSKIAGWEKQMTALAEKYGIAPYAVTVDDFRYQTPQKWGANYYNVNQLGLGEKDASGVLMVINPSSRDLWFLGHGAGEQAFTVYGIEKLYDHVKQPLGDDHWDDGVDVYLTQVADYLEQWKAGTPYSASHPLPHPITLESTTAGVAGAAALGGGAGTLVMRRIRKKHDTAHLQWGAIYYVVPGSDQITGSNDVFVNEYTTQVARPKSSDSSDFSGGSFSSGGTSFSSGGGKF